MSEDALKCACGKPVQFWSSLLEQGFCNDDHYAKARGITERPVFKHDQFDEEDNL